MESKKNFLICFFVGNQTYTMLVYQTTMFDKKHKKRIQILWTIASVLLILGMVLVYLPGAF